MTSTKPAPADTRAETLATRLARVAERTTSGAVIADARAQQAILLERARALAMPRAEPDDAAAADRLPVIVFVIGGERLAIPLESVVAIIPAPIVTPLPRAVAPVYGVTAWRGRPLTVLSIGAAAPEGDTPRRILVLGDGRRAVAGLLADSVDETRVVARATLSPVPPGVRSAMAIGMTEDAVLVLDANALLNAARPEP